MKRLTVILCLSLAVLLGSVGTSWSADFQKGLTAYNSGDYADALREWEPLAEQGNAPTQFNLGLMYDDGKGVPQDHKTAAKWYRFSAEQGYANAQYNLGFMYDKGNGIPQDYETAAKWYRLAAEQGNANAQNNLGVIYDKGNHVPLVLFRTPHPDWTGTWQDYKIAVKWFRLAAKQGDPAAQSNLGGMYDKRRGVPQDYETAAKWYTLAADQGHAIAQSNLEILQKKMNSWWKIW